MAYIKQQKHNTTVVATIMNGRIVVVESIYRFLPAKSKRNLLTEAQSAMCVFVKKKTYIQVVFVYLPNLFGNN